MSSATTVELIIFILFFLLILRFLQQKRSEELLTLVLPVILVMAFIEAMAVKAGKFVYNFEGFHFTILYSPLAILLVYVIGIYVAFFITGKAFYRYRVSLIPILSFSDSTICTATALIISFVGLRLEWWRFFPESDFLIKGHFFGSPIWEFFGLFLITFIFSLGYRAFKKFDFKKRIILTYSYIFLILTIRLFVYSIISGF